MIGVIGFIVVAVIVVQIATIALLVRSTKLSSGNIEELSVGFDCVTEIHGEKVTIKQADLQSLAILSSPGESGRLSSVLTKWVGRAYWTGFLLGLLAGLWLYPRIQFLWSAD